MSIGLQHNIAFDELQIVRHCIDRDKERDTTNERGRVSERCCGDVGEERERC